MLYWPGKGMICRWYVGNAPCVETAAPARRSTFPDTHSPERAPAVCASARFVSSVLELHLLVFTRRSFRAVSVSSPCFLVTRADRSLCGRILACGNHCCEWVRRHVHPLLGLRQHAHIPLQLCVARCISTHQLSQKSNRSLLCAQCAQCAQCDDNMKTQGDLLLLPRTGVRTDLRSHRGRPPARPLPGGP
jgi:hypothetical protein